MQIASQEKATDEHNVIDDAIKERGDGYTVFSIPVGILYRPSEIKLRNKNTKDYMGKAVSYFHILLVQNKTLFMDRIALNRSFRRQRSLYRVHWCNTNAARTYSLRRRNARPSYFRTFLFIAASTGKICPHP